MLAVILMLITLVTCVFLFKNYYEFSFIKREDRIFNQTPNLLTYNRFKITLYVQTVVFIASLIGTIYCIANNV